MPASLHFRAMIVIWWFFNSMNHCSRINLASKRIHIGTSRCSPVIAACTCWKVSTWVWIFLAVRLICLPLIIIQIWIPFTIIIWLRIRSRNIRITKPHSSDSCPFPFTECRLYRGHTLACFEPEVLWNEFLFLVIFNEQHPWSNTFTKLFCFIPWFMRWPRKVKIYAFSLSVRCCPSLFCWYICPSFGTVSIETFLTDESQLFSI